jgi:hypothetical protein
VNTGALIVEGFDGAGALVACGQSPSFPVTAINARIVVYMAAPRSLAVAPVALATPRSEVSAAALGYGAVIAGGRDAAGPSSAIAVYNAFDHSLIDGRALPEPRAGVAIATSNGDAYLFGGLGPDDNPTGTLWRFDTTASPNGAYAMLGNQPALARAGQLMVPSLSGYLVTGAPPLTIAGSGTIVARDDIAALPPAGAGVGIPGNFSAIFVDQQLVRYRNDAFDTLGAGPGKATAAALRDGRIVVFGGDPPSRDALVINATSGAVTPIPNALAIARSQPLLAVTPRHLLVARGTDAAGAPLASAELFDAATLAPIAMLPALARTGGFAIALPNDQVLLGGGTPASSQLELFTPEPPELPE